MRLYCNRCNYETPLAECETELMEGGRIEQFLLYHLQWECDISRVEIFSNGKMRRYLIES